MQEIEMKSRVRGRVVLPDEEGYDAERNGWSLIVEHRPAIIVVAAYSDADYGRLAAIKAAYDPRNLFRINHNIPPSS